jgi:hypothetical protein
MTTGWSVDVEAICRQRSLPLFVNGHNAWEHMYDHVLGIRKPGEEEGWGLLLPDLQIELRAGRLANLQHQARQAGLSPNHVTLGPIYKGFLDLVQRSVQRADRLGWFWEERPGSVCRWVTFSPEGIVTHLDEDYVRTGYLPEHDPSKWSGGGGNGSFRLFQACLRRVQHKYDRAVKSRKIESIQPALETILRSGLAETKWAALA